jgi:ParB family chromosome partitioning protein
MTDIQSTFTSTAQLIEAGRLVRSPLNARRTETRMGMGELKASLLAHGLMQNLVVTDAGDGTYRVIAGGRRLQAIHALQFEGKLPPHFAVPCQIVTEEHALEMSLAENTVRLEMHPADQFEAFAALIHQGESAGEVANRFGVEESLVLKRMKLACVAPELLEEFRNEGMTLECLMAYTITDDHRKQLKVFKSLQDWQKDEPDAIRAALTDKMLEASDKLARFVGLEAYQQAGGSSRGDLFGNEVYLEKPALVFKLAEAKLDAIRKELEAEGWGWVEVNPHRNYDLIHRCGRMTPKLVAAPAELIRLKSELDAQLSLIEQSLNGDESNELLEQQDTIQRRLDEVEERLASYVGFDEVLKPLAGCFVSIGEDGSPFIDQGLVKPENKKLLAKLLRTDGSDGVTVKAKPKHALPESLRRDLAQERLPIASLELARNPSIALDLLAFQAASQLLGDHKVGCGFDVEFHRPKPGKPRESALADEELKALAKALPAGWLKATSEAERFEAFRSLPEASKLGLLAMSLALTLKPGLAPATGEEATACDVALSLTGSDAATYWRPSKGNFLSRISREQLLMVGRDVLGEDWAQAHRDDKKAVLVGLFDRAFGDPDQSGRTRQQVDRLKRWLPEGMAFGLTPAPKPTKAKKAIKAA